ncbi:MAG: 4Fe-4S dicluster domain-containing protein [Halobacteriota archaeon]|nr:4Fe-4S dicluster domain-containing protein [Halobacteriota archaeon]
MKDIKFLEDTKIVKCVQCGKCSASCPAGRNSRLLTRKIIMEAKSGIDVLGREELWFCTTCFLCFERCPKGVNTVDAIIELRNRAVMEGKFPEVHVVAIEGIYDTGSGLPLSPDGIRDRSMLGLEKEPEDIARNESDFKDFQKLIKELGLLEKVGVKR